MVEPVKSTPGQSVLTLFVFTLAFLPGASPMLARQSSAADIPVVRRVTPLTGERGDYVRPAWSPDGRWLALGRAGMAGIEILRPDGSEWKVLTAEPGAGYKFAWSPDSQHLAFRSTRYESNATWHVIKSVEIASGRITEWSRPAAAVQPPVWARSNLHQRVSFVVGNHRSNTVWRVGQAKPARIMPARADTLLYSDRGQIWSCGPGDLGCTNLTEAGGMDPVWSPDRSRIAYSQMDTLMVMEADGSKKRALAEGHHPAWSPDGRRIVYDVSTDDGHRILGSDLWVINADGTQPTRLTHTPDVLETEPAWSPDGKCIACRTEDFGRVLLLWLE